MQEKNLVASDMPTAREVAEALRALGAAAAKTGTLTELIAGQNAYFRWKDRYLRRRPWLWGIERLMESTALGNTILGVAWEEMWRKRRVRFLGQRGIFAR